MDNLNTEKIFALFIYGPKQHHPCEMKASIICRVIIWDPGG